MNKNTQEYDQRWRQYLDVTHSRLLDAIPADIAPRSILDLGCGTGLLLTKLRDRYPDARLTGIDRSGAMLALAQQRLPQATFVNADIENHRFEPGQFDLIVSSSVFHFVDVPRVLSNVVPALFPGGRLVVVDYRGESRLKVVSWLFNLLFEPQRALSRHELAREVTNAGLEVEDQQSFNWRWYLLQVVRARLVPG